jgi:hypothetical protein
MTNYILAREFLLARPVGILVPPFHKEDQNFAFMAAHAVPEEVAALTALLIRVSDEAVERCAKVEREAILQIVRAGIGLGAHQPHQEAIAEAIITDAAIRGDR